MSRVIEDRLNQLQQLKALGIEPFPSVTFPTTHTTKEILEQWEKNPEAFNKVALAGRLMVKRVMGKASFGVLQDSWGRIQLYFNRDILCPGEDKTLYNTVFKKLIAHGDIIGVEGRVFKTKTGEITIEVQRFVLLAKALRPLPMPKEKDGKVWDAFTDPEQRYRRRYVDLIVNPHVREIFRKRAKIIQTIRNFLIQQGFLEVETPILQPIYGGANAKPFVTYHNALGMRLYLRIANELYLKRLIVGGYDAVFEFAKDFRNEGIDKYHNPEFTQLEFYVAYKDYRWMMDFIERLLEYTAKAVVGTTSVTFQNQTIDFKRPWKRVSFYESIQLYTGLDAYSADEATLRRYLEEQAIEVPAYASKGVMLDLLFSKKVEPHLIQPTIVYDYPVEMSPLAKQKVDDPTLTERFEVICSGKELCNAFSELNDPIEQRKRFEAQLQLRRLGDEEAMVMDEDFIQALEFGMPPTAGLGLGIDRLTMLLTDSPSIQEVLFFPQMRPKQRADEESDLSRVIGEEAVVAQLEAIGIRRVEDLLAIEPSVLQEKLQHRNIVVDLNQIRDWIRFAKRHLAT